ncbi:MAG TPA: RcnB family protein [Burkholderiaceae bacterium]
MRYLKLGAATLAAALGFANLAVAQPAGRPGPHQENRAGPEHAGRGGPQGMQHRPNGPVQAQPQYRQVPAPQFYGPQPGRYVRGPGYEGAGPEHAFRWGERLPSNYRNRQYVVNDWRVHHLYAPPRGQQWVQVGADYVLVAIATGVIAALVLNSN